MGPRTKKASGGQKYHGKTLDEILNPKPICDTIDVQIGDKIETLEWYSRSIPTSHIGNFNVGAAKTKLEFPKTGQTLEQSMAHYKAMEDRKNGIKKAELDGMFEVWARDLIDQIALIKLKIKDLYANDETFKNANAVDRFTVITTHFKTFTEKHPIVVQKMTVDGVYSEKAFRKYLLKRYQFQQKLIRKEADPKTERDEHFKHQADYALYLYREVKNFNTEEAKRTWSITYKAFRDTEDDMKKSEKESKQYYDEQDKINEEELKLEMIERLRESDMAILETINKQIAALKAKMQTEVSGEDARQVSSLTKDHEPEPTYTYDEYDSDDDFENIPEDQLEKRRIVEGRFGYVDADD